MNPLLFLLLSFICFVSMLTRKWFFNLSSCLFLFCGIVGLSIFQDSVGSIQYLEAKREWGFVK